MSTQDAANAIHENRQAVAFVLASILASYPDEQAGEYVGALLSDNRLEGVLDPEMRAQVETIFASEELLDELRSEYIDRFDRGRSETPLYETEYGRNRAMSKGQELADLAGFYRAFGLSFENAGSAEMLDHIAVELEFYATLLMKDELLDAQGDEKGREIVKDARRKFLEDHLGRLAPALAARPGVVESEYFSRVFGFCRDLVAAECARVEARPSALEWNAAASRSSEKMGCGSGGGCSCG